MGNLGCGLLKYGLYRKQIATSGKGTCLYIIFSCRSMGMRQQHLACQQVCEQELVTWPTRQIHFGTSVASVCRDMTQQDVAAFYKHGLLCIRAYNPCTGSPLTCAEMLECACHNQISGGPNSCDNPDLRHELNGSVQPTCRHATSPASLDHNQSAVSFTQAGSSWQEFTCRAEEELRKTSRVGLTQSQGPACWPQLRATEALEHCYSACSSTAPPGGGAWEWIVVLPSSVQD